MMRGNGVKVLLFVIIMGLLSAFVGLVIGGFRVQDTSDYHARFKDVSGLVEGSDVRAAGVTLGRVESVELEPDNTIDVAFSVPTDLPLTSTTRAAVRYKNLTGDRYLDLTEGDGGGRRLAEDDVIPVSRTAQALDLDALFNGFKPLFQALNPDQINQLSQSLITTFQGQSANMNGLLANIGSLTAGLADRDQIIGRVIDNLNEVLGTVDARRAETTRTVDQLQQLVSGLAADRQAIGDSLAHINDLAATTNGFLAELRPELRGSVHELDRVSRAINQESALVDRNLALMPQVFERLGRGGAHGSFFNFYVCGSRLKLTGPDGQPVLTPFMISEVPRCKFQ